MDLNSLPEGTPVWVITAGALTTLFLTLSEKAAKLPGGLGAAARWWNTRQVREVRRRKGLDAEINELVDEKVGWVRAEMRASIKDLKGQIEKLQKTERLQHSYIVWITSHLRRIEVWAADRGLELPPPPFMTFTEFVAEREADREAEQSRHPPDAT